MNNCVHKYVCQILIAMGGTVLGSRLHMHMRSAHVVIVDSMAF
jgi:hypothetical protein